jgi:hypothetical protein
VVQNSLYAIGDPGRAALEVPDGPPPARIGPADVELSSADLPGMVIRAASSRGILHRSQATVRQDAFALSHRGVPGEPVTAILVVCDGVGSLERSDLAAVYASRHLAALAVEGLSWPDAFRQANEGLREHALDGIPVGSPADMATTAVAARVYRDGSDWVGDAGWVGDSSLWHLDDHGRWAMLGGPPPENDADAYHSGHVRPLPSAEGECTASGFRVGGGALFLMTDGVANPLMWGQDVQAALAEWWRWPPDPFTFAAQIGFARRTHMDDRTVVGIWSTHDAREESEPRAAQAAV